MIKAEWKNIAKSTWLKIVLCAIMIIPMIYACVFLGSMWDPYGQTDQLPVAVVNKDKEVEYNDSTMDIGKQLSDKLSKNDSMDFNIVSSTKAQKGLKDGKYYMIITIPENFSKNATTLLDDDPQTMMLTYTTNPQTNYIATKMDDSAMAKVKTEISSTVTKTYSKILFKNVKTLSKGFNTAADGSQKLSDGVATASEGNKTITENLNTLASSALVFNDGADSLVKGLSAYTEGVSTAKAGAQQLDNNSATLNNGAAQLKSGSSQLLSAVKAAEKQLSDGLNQNAEQLNTLTQKNNEMNESSKQLSQALTQIQAGIDNNNLVENNLQAAKKLDSIVSVMTTAIGTMNTNADKLDKLAAAEKAKAESIQATQPLLAQQLMLQATSHATQAQTLRQVASQLINQVNTSDLKKIDDSGVTYGIIPVPYLSEGLESVPMSITTLAVVNPYTSDISVAKTVARAISYDYAADMQVLSGHVSARADLIKKGRKADNTDYNMLHDIYSDSIVKAKYVGVQNIYTRYEILIHQIWDGKSIDDAYNEFHKGVESFLTSIR